MPSLLEEISSRGPRLKVYKSTSSSTCIPHRFQTASSTEHSSVTYDMASGLPPNKRHIATHDADGKSVYAKPPEQAFAQRGSAGYFAKSYSVANVPAVLKDDVDIKAYTGGPENVTSFQSPGIVVPSQGGKNNGANLLVVDLVPGGFSQLHRTVSIDYSICCIGTIIHGECPKNDLTEFPTTELNSCRVGQRRARHIEARSKSAIPV